MTDQTTQQPADLPFASTGRPVSGSEWTRRYNDAVMHTFGDPQRVLVRGEGSYVWDVDGNRYLDLLGGIAVNALGQAHPALIKAVGEQLGQLGHISNFFTSEPQIRLAERLSSLLAGGDHAGRGAGPWAAECRVFFCNSGAEANEAAFKATRQTGRTKVVVAEGSFHGRTMGALALTSKAAYREPFEPLPGDVTWVPYGDADALEAAVDDTTAAVLLEPLQGEAGVIVPPDDYLSAARRITSEHGALLWIDEVQTGVARTGDWFAFQRAGITPDLITLAKGLGGGIPIGACVGVGAAGELLGPGNHGTTFGGNPMATAAALAVLETIQDEGLLAHARLVGDRLAEGLLGHPRVVDVQGRGLMRGVVLDAPIAADLVREGLDAGLILNAPTPERLRLVPPLVITETEVDHAVRTLHALLDEAPKGEGS